MKEKTKKKFFKSESERNLWIRLNAEHIRDSQKKTNNSKEDDLGSVDEQYSHMWVSNNQLTYDESERDAPRFSFEELLLLSHEELLKITRKRHMEFIQEIFSDININNRQP